MKGGLKHKTADLCGFFEYLCPQRRPEEPLAPLSPRPASQPTFVAAPATGSVPIINLSG